MYSVRLYHGWEETDFGVDHAFVLADPRDNISPDSIKELSRQLDCSPDCDGFNFDIHDLVIPDSVVDRIRASRQKQYLVSLAVDGRAEICVNAENFEEAKRKAMDRFTEFDCGDLECVEWKAVNAESSDGEFHDY